MSIFTYNDSKIMFEDQYYTTCHTAGCAVGWAPFAGILKQPTETWIEFSERTLTDDEDMWNYMFSTYWADVDNTILGAAKRIQNVINGYIPDSFYDPTECVVDYSHVEVLK